MDNLSQGEVSQVAEERSQDEREEDKEGEVDHQVNPVFLIKPKCPKIKRRKLSAYQVRIREYMGRNGAKEPEM